MGGRLHLDGGTLTLDGDVSPLQFKHWVRIFPTTIEVLMAMISTRIVQWLASDAVR